MCLAASSKNDVALICECIQIMPVNRFIISHIEGNAHISFPPYTNSHTQPVSLPLEPSHKKREIAKSAVRTSSCSIHRFVHLTRCIYSFFFFLFSYSVLSHAEIGKEDCKSISKINRETHRRVKNNNNSNVHQ